MALPVLGELPVMAKLSVWPNFRFQMKLPSEGLLHSKAAETAKGPPELPGVSNSLLPENPPATTSSVNQPKRKRLKSAQSNKRQPIDGMVRGDMPG